MYKYDSLKLRYLTLTTHETVQQNSGVIGFVESADVRQIMVDLIKAYSGINLSDTGIANHNSTGLVS